MQIEIKTNAYATNKNVNAIIDAIIASGFYYKVQLGGKYCIDGAVTLHTDAPATVLDGIKYTASAVTITA